MKQIIEEYYEEIPRNASHVVVLEALRGRIYQEILDQQIHQLHACLKVEKEEGEITLLRMLEYAQQAKRITTIINCAIHTFIRLFVEAN